MDDCKKCKPSFGLIIGRMNPPHLGHISLIEKALKENSKVLIFVGIKNEKNSLDENNPLSYEQIKSLLNIKYKRETGQKRLIINFLVDKETDEEWVLDLKMKIENEISGFEILNFYCGDFKRDSAYIALKENEDKFNDTGKKLLINYFEVSREKSFVNFLGKEYLISSTNLREALRNGNYELAEKFCDEKMFEEIRFTTL